MSETQVYLPGNGYFKTGELVRYVGKGGRYLEDVTIGTVGTVTHDFGYDYRYIVTFSEPTVTYPGRDTERVATSLRTSGNGWEKVTNADR